MRTFLMGLALAALTLSGCRADVDVDTADSPTPAPTDTVRDFPPTEEIGDCADVTATEGAPAPITMMDTFFEPLCVAVSSTQHIILTNAGNQLHNFTVEDDQFDIDVEPGEDAETDEVGDTLRAGTYRFFCKYHQGRGMVGTLLVE